MRYAAKHSASDMSALLHGNLRRKRMIYLLMLNYPHEGDEVLGAYSTAEKAEAAKLEAIKKDNSNGYNEFTIDEVELE